MDTNSFARRQLSMNPVIQQVYGVVAGLRALLLMAEPGTVIR